MAHRTIIHTRYMHEDLSATELKSTLSTKHGFVFVRSFCKADQFFQLRSHHIFVFDASHIHYTLYRFFPSLVAPLVLHPSGIAHVEFRLSHHIFTNFTTFQTSTP